MRSTFLLLAACQSVSTAGGTGGVGERCYPNGTCDVGLSCVDGFCQDPPDAGVDASFGIHRDAAPDAPSDATCDDPHEPNDSLADATALALSSNQASVPQAAICPDGDVDLYTFVLPAGDGSVFADVVFSAGGAKLSGFIGNNSAAPVTVMQPFGANEIRAYASTLPSNQTYTVKVYAMSGTNPSYQLTLQVSP